jgi:hypothetical protein
MEIINKICFNVNRSGQLYAAFNKRGREEEKKIEKIGKNQEYILAGI